MALGTLPNDESEDDSVFAEINITPLTDVFLVLLIIFMVTSSAINQSGVTVSLPKAGAASSSASKKGITITLASNGDIYIGKNQTSFENLDAALSAELATATNRSVILAGDESVMLSAALRVMNIAKKAGATKFGIATKTGGISGDK